jgi:hypothetical protein
LRHLAEVAEGAGHKSAAILGKPLVLFCCGANLLPLLRSKMLNRLSVLNHAAALFGRHVVELREVVSQGLLGLRREIAEAGLILERALLLCQGQIAVTVHPLAQMLLFRLSTILLGSLGRMGRVHRRPSSLRPAHERRLSRNRHCCR